MEVRQRGKVKRTVATTDADEFNDILVTNVFE